MSIRSIKQYHSEVEKIAHFGGTKKETAIRNAFYFLLNEYAKQQGLMLVPEITIKGTKGKNVIPDGTLKDSLRQDWGYWESKDEADNIDDEIEKKFEKGYPRENILFEDSNTAVLIQNGNEVMRVSMNDTEALDRIIKEFISFKRPEVENFHTAIELFKQDIPKVTETLRGIILAEDKTNKLFKDSVQAFLEICRDSINPEISLEDVREMMIQHILTEDIFNTIFDETQFHRENNIACELEKVIHTFFKGNIKRIALSAIQHYYQAINAAAAQIADHHEKQKFLKVVYEIFYKGYNPKAADRLGVVYTPNEIVKFMIESTDFLLHEHFGMGLEDDDVEILDPATGTGTFICDIIDYLPKNKLPYKYQNKIHANEVAILPYYIANLNIEYTYKQKMGEYKEFENLCFVDTLENLGFDYKYKQNTIFGFSAENSERIKRQNDKKISVIIGNPPYNANQMNENENNKNRTYPILDKLIKDSYIKCSTAQKTKVYDMYARFYRWAMERLDKNGIVAFITNRSFIDSRTFDGFRQVVASEFSHIYVIDLGGDVRANPKLSGTKHNVFGIQTGVAIAFMVKMKNPIEANSRKEFNKLKREFDIVEEPVIIYNSKGYYSTQGCRIKYYRRPEFDTAEQKLDFLGQTRFVDIPFDNVRPDKNNNWINIAVNDWEEMLPICSKEVKAKKGAKAIFELFSTGISTNRDEWIVDLSSKNLLSKMKFFVEIYNKSVEFNTIIKWSRNLKNRHARGLVEKYSSKKVIRFNYRPYFRNYLYHSNLYIDEQGLQKYVFSNENLSICISGIGASKRFQTIGVDSFTSLDFLEKTQCLPLYRYEKDGIRIDNITDWGLTQFQTNYNDKTITKQDIFYYIYAVLHNPAYRTKYELNIKRDFPRIPFYADFRQWAAWGKELMDLHIGFENATPFELKEITQDEPSNPKPKLKADKQTGTIILDEATILTGVPKDAWFYQLGNRSALEWILDQYKEKKPKDPTIAEQFDNYRFADYKPQAIDLLKRVCTVSVETIRILSAMEKSV